MSTQQSVSVYLDLVCAMGAPRYGGFNPIAPAQHRWMMDASQPEETRTVGWALWRTIDRDPDGKTGPPKKKRTPIAHDDRVGKSGHLEVRHMAEDLGVSVANATDAVRRAQEKGLIAVTETGAIYARGDGPLPRRIRSEDEGDGENGQTPIYFCTENCPESYRLSFQQLDKKRRAQYTRLYRAMPQPFAEHLEKLQPVQRAHWAWRYLEGKEYDERLDADAIAAARANHVTDKVMSEAGFQSEETRGRNPVSRDLTIKLEVKVSPEEFSVQKTRPNFVQNGNGNLYGRENGSVQKTASLSPLPVVPRDSQSEVKPGSVENRAPEQDKAAPAAQPSGSREPLPDGIEKLNAVREALESRFGHKLRTADKLPEQFLELAAQRGLPTRALVKWIHAKMDERKGFHYHVSSPGALLKFAVEDLPKWMRLNRTLLENMAIADDREHVRQVHQEAARAAGAGEPFDPLGYGPTMEDLKQKTRMK